MILPLALVVLVACAPHEAIIDYLQNMYQEVIISFAVHNNGGIIEVAVNEKTGTWSILMTMPMQSTCVIASGDGWRAVVPKETLGEKDA